MQVLLLLLFVRTTSTRPIGQEIFYDFDDDYGADLDPHDYDWPQPLATTGRPIPVRPCGVICQFERQGRGTSSLSNTTTMSNLAGTIAVETPGMNKLVQCYCDECF